MTDQQLMAGVTDAQDPPSLLYAVKQVELAVRAHLDALLRPAGLTTTQYTALSVLGRRNGLTGAQLARSSFVTAQSMQDVVAALENRALVHKEPDPANRRRLLIRLTEDGRATLASVRDAVDALDTSMTQALTADERQAFRRALNLCRAALTGAGAASS